MEAVDFNRFLDKFRTADSEERIDLYCHTPDLTQEQYMQLLRLFPPSQIKELEKAMD